MGDEDDVQWRGMAISVFGGSAVRPRDGGVPQAPRLTLVRGSAMTSGHKRIDGVPCRQVRCGRSIY